MLCHFVIRRIEHRCIPVALFAVNGCGAVIRDQNRSCAAEEFKHVDVGIDPVPCPFVHECFDEGVLAVGKNTNKQPAVSNLPGIGINDVGGISGPVNFDLLSGFSGDVHGSTPFLLILADVLAELGIHERFVAGLAAKLAVFNPQKLFGYSVPQKFFADIAIVRQTLVCC